MSRPAVNVQDIVHGKPSGEHEPMDSVLHGWGEFPSVSAKARLAEKKRRPLPSDFDRDFQYGLSTREINAKSDPLWRSNAIVEQKIARQEKIAARDEAKKAKPVKRIDPRRPTAASQGHSKVFVVEASPKETFKMKRFANIGHGKIDTGNGKKAT